MSTTPWLTIGIGVIKTEHLALLFDSIGRWRRPCQIVIVDDRADSRAARIQVPSMPQHQVEVHVNPKNIGSISPARVWNQALKHARASWICIGGDDDIFGLGWDEAMFNLAQANPACGVLRSRLKIIGENGATREWGPMVPDAEPWYEMAYARCWHDRLMSLGEHVFNTAALVQNGGFPDLPNAWGSDDLAVVRASRQGGIVSTNAVWYGWRHHSRSITGSKISPTKTLAMNSLFAQYNALIDEQAASLPAEWTAMLRLAVDRRKQVELLRLREENSLGRFKRRLAGWLKSRDPRTLMRSE